MRRSSDRPVRAPLADGEKRPRTAIMRARESASVKRFDAVGK